MTPVLRAAVAPIAPWLGLGAPGARYVALPPGRHPVVVAELSAEVLRYVRTALLAPPPGSRLPGWACALAGQGLRAPAVLRLLPGSHVTEGTRSRGELAQLVGGAGNRLLVLQHSRDADASWLLLVFPPGAQQPRYAVKLAGSAGAAVRVHREAERLTALAQCTGTRLGASVPRVLDMVGYHGRPALVTTAQRGVPMLVRYHRGGHTASEAAVAADLTAAERWLARLQCDCAGPPAPLDVAAATLARLAELAEEEPTAARVLDGVAALRRRLRRHSAPTTVVHGDFWPGNLLTESGEVSGVVDWERSEPAGSPLRDPARFVLAYSYYLDRHTRPGRRVRGHRELVAGTPGAGVGYALDRSGWYPRLVRRFLDRALERSGLPASCARDAVLAEVAALAAEGSDPDFSRDHLALFLALSEGAR